MRPHNKVKLHWRYKFCNDRDTTLKQECVWSVLPLGALLHQAKRKRKMHLKGKCSSKGARIAHKEPMRCFYPLEWFV